MSQFFTIFFELIMVFSTLFMALLGSDLIAETPELGFVCLATACACGYVVYIMSV